MTAGAMSSVREASDSRAMTVAARIGLAARAFVYLVIGWFGLDCAWAGRASRPIKKVCWPTLPSTPMAWSCCGCWRWDLRRTPCGGGCWQVAFGVAGEGMKAGRLSPVCGACGCLRSAVSDNVCVHRWTLPPGSGPTAGNGDGEAHEVRPRSRRPAGLVGLIVVIVGLAMIVEGVTRKFETQLKMSELRAATCEAVIGLGVVGTAARGVVFAVAGGLASMRR